MKCIAVSMRIDEYPLRNEIRDSVDRSLVSYIMEAGYTPIYVPNSYVFEGKIQREQIINILNQNNISAILLSGGNDIGDYRDRDETEMILLDYAESKWLPVLGICRGMQVLGTRAGVGLKRVENHIKIEHQVRGKSLRIVNSFHSLALDRCPENYRVEAMSDDGVIEAIMHESMPWRGIMWHPERNSSIDLEDVNELRELFG